VIPGLHCDSGFRLTTVSNISRGAGSVGVSARPALPNTCDTSGIRIRIRSWSWMSLDTSDTEAAGTVTGIYNSEPSYSGGINSVPSLVNGITVTTIIITAIKITVLL